MYLKKNIKIIYLILAVFLLAITMPVASAASPEIITGYGPADPSEIEAFMDNVVTAGLEKYNVPGATVAVIRNDSILFIKGYGLANISENMQVNGIDTIFRVGSVSKLPVWIAVLKLIEEGKIDPDADVNNYLTDLTIPETYTGRPVTMRHLMTHSEGFEEVNENRFYAPDAKSLTSIIEVLAATEPARNWPPGKIFSYSNYGETLAAHIIEEVTGVPYYVYIKNEIFSPLGMNSTTYMEPVPRQFAYRTATGYSSIGETETSEPFEYIRVSPAGGLSSTGKDIAALMLFLSGNGTYNGHRILEEETLQEMFVPAISREPGAPFVSMGMYESEFDGVRFIGHDGDTAFFHSRILFEPEINVAFFMTYNSDQGSAARRDLTTDIVQHYFQGSTETLQGSSNASLCAGLYRDTRISYTKIDRFFNPPTELMLQEGENNTIAIYKGGKGYYFLETAPFIFSRSDPQITIFGFFFSGDHNGPASEMYTLDLPVIAWERIEWYQSTTFAGYVLYGCCILFLSSIIWPGFYLRSRFSKDKKNSETLVIYAQWLLVSAAVVDLVFVAAITMLAGNSEFITAFYINSINSVPAVLYAILSLPVISIILTVGSVISAFREWINKEWSLILKLHYILVIIACIVFFWWLDFWNLLGFKF